MSHDKIRDAIDHGGGQVCDITGVIRELDLAGFMIMPRRLRPIADAPRDGREVLCTDGKIWRVCVPKMHRIDVWEYFRDEAHCPGHTWSMVPTHFILIEDLPQVPK